MAQKTASRYGSSFVRGSHRFRIIGYRERKALASVTAGNSSSVQSGDFEVGGHTWALRCRFGKQGLASISLNLVSTKSVTAMASLRIDDPRRRWPAAVWRSDVPNAFPSDGIAASGQGWRWELTLPEAFCGHEERYVEDDHLAILCVVDVLDLRAARSARAHKFFISLVPPPTLSRDLLGLLFPPKSKLPPESVQRHRRPDVTFIVEGIEIHAHKIFLAMESPVFAAEFRWHNDESRIIRVDDMSASTFRAMLRYCYTGNVPIKPRRNATLTCHSDKEKCALRRFVSMILDLLVAADRYDLERLRTLCGNILVECMDAVSIIHTLMVVHGRQSFQQLDDSCIEYIASHPDVYTAMKETEEYKDLKEGCCSFLLEITDKVAMNMARNMRSPFTYKRNIKSTPSNNLSKDVHGTHEFTIPNFRAAQRSIVGVDKIISSEIFQIGGYAWKIRVKISNSSYLPEEQQEEPITVFLQLSSHLRSVHIRTSMSFKMDYPSATPPIEQVTKTFAEKFDCSYTEFTVMKSAKPARDDSLTIHCQLMVSEEAYAASGTTTAGVRDEIFMPSSNIASHLEHLLVSEQGSDLWFLVEECDFHAHGFVIAARSPTLYEMVAAAASQIVHVNHMKATVFRSVLHFIYTDKLPSIDELALTAEDMLTAACRFGLERIKIMCENLLAEYISEENALNTLKLAQRHHCLKLENYCLEFMALPHVTKRVLETISLE